MPGWLQALNFCSTFQVARDSGNDGDESLNAIDIPPPRPKKKPLHPYPRKMADSSIANKAVSGQPERSPSPNASGRESCSPDSVLPAIGLGIAEYSVAEQQNSRFSPVSCTTDAHTANIISTENDDESMSSNSNNVDAIHVTLKPVAASISLITNSEFMVFLLKVWSMCFAMLFKPYTFDFPQGYMCLFAGM